MHVSLWVYARTRGPTEGDMGRINHASEDSLTRRHRAGRATYYLVVIVVILRFDVYICKNVHESWRRTEDTKYFVFVPLDMPRCEGAWLGSPLGVDAALLDDSFGLRI